MVIILDFTVRCEALTAENEASSSEDIQKESEETKLQYKRLKVTSIWFPPIGLVNDKITFISAFIDWILYLQEENASFRDLADRMIEEKDKEISRLLDDNKNLQRSLESRLMVCFPFSCIVVDLDLKPQHP